MPAKESLVGQHFGKLKVIADAPRYFYKGGSNSMSRCLCDCGRETVVRTHHLKMSVVRSCGCLTREATIKRNTTHGGSGTRIWGVWRGVKDRCKNPKSHAFKDYGGRGIKLHKPWNDFRNFLDGVGEGKKGWTLERINNNGDYEPMNICWATRKQQSRNTRANVIMTVLGVTGCVADLCDHFNIKSSIVWHRLYRGWKAEAAFTITPLIRILSVRATLPAAMLDLYENRFQQ